MGARSILLEFLFSTEKKYYSFWGPFFVVSMFCSSCVLSNAQGIHFGSKKQPSHKYVQLPVRSNDCFYAVELQVGQKFGPTTPPQGCGFVKEGLKDDNNPHMLDEERNSVWYKVDIPYSGKLYFTLTPLSALDNYDFVVYKYTNRYFCNRVHRNEVEALRVNKSLPDSKIKGATGLSLKSKSYYVNTHSQESFSSYIDALKGETYYILVSSDNDQGLGHTILVEVDTKFIPLYLTAYEASSTRKRIPADYLIQEVETGRIIADESQRNTYKAKLVPNYNYRLTIKKEGYFDYLSSFPSMDYVKDSVVNINLVPIKKGSILPFMSEIYFNDKQDEVLSESLPALDRVVEIMNESQSMKIEIIGNVSSIGFEPEKDLLISALRANTVKNYLIGKGVSEKRMTSRGMTMKELERGIVAAQKNPKFATTPNCQIKVTDYKRPHNQAKR